MTRRQAKAKALELFAAQCFRKTAMARKKRKVAPPFQVGYWRTRYVPEVLGAGDTWEEAFANVPPPPPPPEPAPPEPDAEPVPPDESGQQDESSEPESPEPDSAEQDDDGGQDEDSTQGGTCGECGSPLDAADVCKHPACENHKKEMAAQLETVNEILAEVIAEEAAPPPSKPLDLDALFDDITSSLEKK